MTVPEGGRHPPRCSGRLRQTGCLMTAECSLVWATTAVGSAAHPISSDAPYMLPVAATRLSRGAPPRRSHAHLLVPLSPPSQSRRMSSQPQFACLPRAGIETNLRDSCGVMGAGGTRATRKVTAGMHPERRALRCGVAYGASLEQTRLRHKVCRTELPHRSCRAPRTCSTQEHGEARLASTTDVPATRLRTLLRIDAKGVCPDALRTAANGAAQVAPRKPRTPLTRNAAVAEEKRIGALEHARPERLEGGLDTTWPMGHCAR